MRSFLRAVAVAIGGAALLAPWAEAHHQAGCARGGGFTASALGFGHLPFGAADIEFSRPPGIFFEAPMGGYTLYAGEAGSGASAGSDYSHINYPVPPAIAAQQVQARLREMGIPPVPPETQFLNKNPRAADNLKLPTPKGWVPKEKDKEPDDPEEKAKDKDKDKEMGKDKDKDKAKIEKKKDVDE